MRLLYITIAVLLCCNVKAQQQFFLKKQQGQSIIGILDDYTGAEIAYATNKLLYSTLSVTDDNASSETFNQTALYTVRVRRENDDAIRSFTYTEIQDGTLTTWTGANDAYVEKWYTQNGSNHSQNSVLLDQPQIVSSGVLVSNNLLFDNDNGKSELLTTTTVSSSTHSTFIIFERGSNSNAVILANTNSYTDVLFINDTNIRYKSGGVNYTLSGINLISGTRYLLSIIRTSTSVNFFINGVLAGTISAANNFTFDRIGTTGTLFVEKNIECVVHYNSDKTSERVTIENILNSAFLIY